jgi:hypothetical protein
MEPERIKCAKGSQINNAPKSFSNLSYVKCLFLTNEQYNNEPQVHKPKQSLYVEKDINGNSKSNIENEINNIINGIHDRLNSGNPRKNFKIPAPIFVLMGRILEKDKSIFQNQNIVKTEMKEYNINGITLKIPVSKSISIISYISDYLSSIFSTEDDRKKYDKSILNNYKFKGNVKLFVYVPYMTNNYKYITNFKDLINSTIFFKELIEDPLYLGMDPTTIFDEDKFRKNASKAKLSLEFQDMFINIYKNVDKKKYRFYDDLANLCYDGGCVSEIGEDFTRLLPQFTNDESNDMENAKKMSPYMPSKCLSKTNNYICNIKDVEGNVSLSEILEKNASEEITKSLSVYERINNTINSGNSVSENENKLISDYNKSPINLLISIVNSYINLSYSTDLNENSKKVSKQVINDKGEPETKEVELKLNHYSKDYSIDIIKELAFLNKLYPTIPEMVMTLYLFKEETLSNKLIYMPFGREMPNEFNTLHFGDEKEVDGILTSTNKKFVLTMNKLGLIYVYNKDNNRVFYYLNRNFVNNALSMNFSESGISVNYTDKNNNRNSRIVYNGKMVNDGDTKVKPPYTCILDNEGLLVIYGNSFYKSTSSALSQVISEDMTKCLNEEWNLDKINNLNNLEDLKGKTSLNDVKVSDNKDNYIYLSGKT